jgi:formylglycine-generating enzyme required for sulfatase activity
MTICGINVLHVGIVLCLVFLSGCGSEPTTAKPENLAASRPSEAAPIKKTTPGGVDMIWAPSGEFMMGDNGLEDATPARAVKITGFYMDAFEVSQAAYEALMGNNPAKYKNPDHPVEQLGWFGALKYCNMRSLKEGLTPCYDLENLSCDFSANGYRLPTEAEWEYACRAGSDTDYSFGSRASDLLGAGWFEGNARNTTQAVGQKKANPWGLYDMHGNVQEWCNDTYSETYYAEAPGQDPCNFIAGDERVLRGGSWADDEESCRSAARYSEAPGLSDVCFGYDAYGFRCVQRVEKPDDAQ